MTTNKNLIWKNYFAGKNDKEYYCKLSKIKFKWKTNMLHQMALLYTLAINTIYQNVQTIDIK